MPGPRQDMTSRSPLAINDADPRRGPLGSMDPAAAARDGGFYRRRIGRTCPSGGPTHEVIICPQPGLQHFAQYARAHPQRRHRAACGRVSHDAPSRAMMAHPILIDRAIMVTALAWACAGLGRGARHPARAPAERFAGRIANWWSAPTVSSGQAAGAIASRACRRPKDGSDERSRLNVLALRSLPPESDGAWRASRRLCILIIFDMPL